MVNRQNWWRLEIIDGCREVSQTVLMDVLAAGGKLDTNIKTVFWMANKYPAIAANLNPASNLTQDSL